MTERIPIEYFSTWLATGERGISSEMIATHLTGVPILPDRWSNRRDSHPHDPSDFRRCELLLRAVPKARQRMDSVGDLSPVWRNLVDHWDEIVALCEEESPGCFDGPRAGGKASKAYSLMKELIEEARAAS
ncbi:hypothetical protein CH305_18155 [Rhodococcus sp. 15-649-2-2]|uniref:hypothetical protein n=1 Tax=Rhodococcus sp. 15-649-2-2 TaxID=2023140 RepID=UPI000B9C45DA|nr:hypothetical protein [Rhodococcus sp. 15-649-2-2]OZE77161.1 hypothetical protein CH305_18155 [Rhodococcus sp. 15-649-2-2]